MINCDVKALVALVAALATFGLSGCGDAANTTSACLTPEQVEQEVDKIAQGIESSQEEVEQKQEAIREVRDRECK